MGFDLFKLREPALLKLRKHEIPINKYLESSTSMRYDEQLLEIEFLRGQDLFRQTDGLRDVSSAGAVLDFDAVGHRHGSW
jgi:hypothetical protein